MEAKIYNQKGKETGGIDLPESVFGLKRNDKLVHQVVVSMQSNARAGTAHTKGRGEVRGGGKKPWRQKGTGRARHGSIRSPIWKGGGVTHGPIKDKDYSRKINKKMRAKALYTVLSQKFRSGEIFFVDTISLSEPKAKLAKSAIIDLAKISGAEGVALRRKNAVYLATLSKDEVLNRAFGNFSQINLDNVRNMNVLDVLKYKYVIITSPEESIKVLASRMEYGEKAGEVGLEEDTKVSEPKKPSVIRGKKPISKGK